MKDLCCDWSGKNYYKALSAAKHHFGSEYTAHPATRAAHDRSLIQFLCVVASALLYAPSNFTISLTSLARSTTSAPPPLSGRPRSPSAWRPIRNVCGLNTNAYHEGLVVDACKTFLSAARRQQLFAMPDALVAAVQPDVEAAKAILKMKVEGVRAGDIKELAAPKVLDEHTKLEYQERASLQAHILTAAKGYQLSRKTPSLTTANPSCCCWWMWCCGCAWGFAEANTALSTSGALQSLRTVRRAGPGTQLQGRLRNLLHS
ncbi:hypothetical protein KFL_011910010 [Klebsormidium nitens]|uniref:Uncharacterized protein n=1 Tax=Klebsormidium nitens TaxID=105231 RepID=A0A1Y1ITK3_KLENI|nr:hypothetical protein KFL_011910010 [Klebsormidium nitens]|eukprot:GAQ92899.1 hypothetical protein KFL_011910010 [Klebsormidium nitens]